MSSRRALKAAQAIREVVGTAILMELKDPRVKDVTVTLVEVSGDLRNAKVYVSIMGNETKQNLCLNGLRSSTGFLQKRVGNRIDTRYIPRIKFVLDKGAKNAMEVTRILNEVLPGSGGDEVELESDMETDTSQIEGAGASSTDSPQSPPPNSNGALADHSPSPPVAESDRPQDLETKNVESEFVDSENGSDGSVTS